jgi:hypothetical protein
MPDFTLIEPPDEPEPVSPAEPDVDALADELRGALTSRQIMTFELDAGITLDELVRTQAGQAVFMVWASRVNGDHALSVADAFAMKFDGLMAEVLELVERSPKAATGVDEPSPTLTESDSSTSQPSASGSGSPSPSSPTSPSTS